MALSPKQAKFVAEYLKGRNATQAAIRAGYSKRSAGQQGHVLLKNPEIAARCAEARVEAAADAKLTLTQHLKDLERLRDEASADGAHSAAVSAEVARGKAAGLHVEKVEHSGTITLEQLVVASRAGDE